MTRSVTFKRLAGTTIALCMAQAGQAEIVWNGFLSAGGGVANPETTSTVLGYEEDATFKNETVLGLQLRSAISDKLSATGQIIARGSEDYDVSMAWAYLSYDANDATTFRIGRFRTPTYLYSDFLEVGYAYHWIAPPEDVYEGLAESIDGVDVVYNIALGSTDLSFQAYAGSLDDSFDRGDTGVQLETQIRNQIGLAATLNFDWLTLRASHHEAEKVSFIGFEDFFIADGIGTIGDLSNSLYALGDASGESGYYTAADNLPVDEEKFTFDEVALKIDWNNILFVTEFTKLKAGSGLINQQNRMFATLGYTFGNIMIHTTYSKSEDDVSTMGDSIPTDVAGLETTSIILKSVIDNLAYGFSDDVSTNAIGIRWDVDNGVAVKAEYAIVSAEDELSKADIGGTLFRFAVDTVF